jgi:rhodanese-related sulfurtransferase
MEVDVPTPIDRHRLRELMTTGAQLVEVLPCAEYDEEHLPGAMNIPLKQLDADAVAVLVPSKPVVV